MPTRKGLIVQTQRCGIKWRQIIIVTIKVCRGFLPLVQSLFTSSPGVNPAQPWYFPEVGFVFTALV